MYSVRIQTRPAAQETSSGGMDFEAEPSCSSAVTSRSPSDSTPQDAIEFSVGNPRVDHITGVVHLYRHIPASRAPHLERGADGPPLPAQRSPQLCILALPPDMGFSELATFMGPHFPKAREVRVVRREGLTSSARLVLLRFAQQGDADEFYLTLGGRAFCSLEPDLLCQTVFVRGVVCDGRALPGWTDGASSKPEVRKSYAAATAGVLSPPPKDNQRLELKVATALELPSCPVCLERLDEDTSGIVTTLCNHRFHNDCLRHWGDSSCPVCRYCQPSAASSTHCSTCACGTDLWVCLICGHVGCGRYRGSHAADHWRESGHGYALELGTQRVWDYLGDAYVHRLVQGKTGKGQKLVEVERFRGRGRAARAEQRRGNPTNTNSHQSSTSFSCTIDSDPDEDAEKEVLALSKYEAVVQEHEHLLVTQLESQRAHFEDLLLRMRAEADQKAQEDEVALGSALEEAKRARREAESARRAQQAAENKLAASKAEDAKQTKELSFLKGMCEALLKNQKEYAEKLNTTEEAVAAQKKKDDATIQELQEQVRDLMVFIEARQTVGSGGGELEGGDLLPVPAAEETQRPRRGQRQRKRP